MGYSVATIDRLIQLANRLDLKPAIMRCSQTELVNLEIQVKARAKAQGDMAAIAHLTNTLEAKQSPSSPM